MPSESEQVKAVGAARDGSMLLLIASAFTFLLIVALVIGGQAARGSDLARGMEGLAVVSFSATIVLFTWALALLCRPSTNDSTKMVFEQLRRIRWRMPRRRVFFHALLVFVAASATHFTLLSFAKSFASSLSIGPREDQDYICLASADVESRLNDHVIKAESNGSSFELVVLNQRIFGWISRDWYTQSQYEHALESSFKAAEKHGWPHGIIDKETARVRAENQNGAALTPVTIGSIGEIVKPYPQLNIDYRGDWNPPELTLSAYKKLLFVHCFVDGVTNLWLRPDGRKLWIREENGYDSTMILVDSERNLVISVTDSNEPRPGFTRTCFTSLSMCLAAILFSWLLFLAPFFYLRLAPPAQTIVPPSTTRQ